MNEKTKADYLYFVTHFLKNRLSNKNINPTEKNIKQTVPYATLEGLP
jgi:hypothetical protein